MSKDKSIILPFEEINTNPTLEECFHFWNEFISKWLKNDKPIEDRRDFNFEDARTEYMPEPWWGWNGEGDLNSVVINYHPGEGDSPQYRINILKIIDGSVTYQGAMGKNLKKELSILQKELKFQSTEEWHLNERAKPLGKLIKINAKDTSRHLSLEFSPFHSRRIDKVICFIKAYPEIVITYVLGFAAQAARQINGSLRSKVFVRVSDINFHRYLKILGFQKISEGETFSGNMLNYKENPQSSFICEGFGNLNSYNLSPWPDIEFIRVTGVRNHFLKLKPIN